MHSRNNDGTVPEPGIVETGVALSCPVPVETFTMPSGIDDATGTVNWDREKPYTSEMSTATTREPSPLTATERDFIGLCVVKYKEACPAG